MNIMNNKIKKTEIKRIKGKIKEEQTNKQQDKQQGNKKIQRISNKARAWGIK